MGAVIKFFVVCFVSTFAMFGALGSENEWPGLIVAFSIWTLYLWSISRPSRREKEHDRMVDEIIRRLENRR